MRWRATEQGWINYPDCQSRIFKNSPDIRWKRPVHEMIEGCKTYAHLPPHEELSLYHPKTIKISQTSSQIDQKIIQHRPKTIQKPTTIIQIESFWSLRE